MIPKLQSKINAFKTKSLRDYRLIISIFTAGLAKTIGMITTLITIPLTLDYLGAEKFGVWMVISGVVGLMSFGDLGIGMGLQNALSEAFGKNEKKLLRYHVSNAFFISCLLFIVLFTLVIATYYLAPFNSIFDLKNDTDLLEAKLALFSALIIFIVGIPINMVQRVLCGIQLTYINNNILLISKIIALFGILLAVWLDYGLIGITVAFIGIPILTLAIYGVYFFSMNGELRPSINFIDKRYFNKIIHAGLWTTLVQIIFTAKTNLPVLIISSSIGLLAVTEFSITQKLVGIVAMMLTVSLQPLWTVYGEAYAKKDKVWIIKTLNKSLKIVVSTAVFFTVILVFSGEYLISQWLSADVKPQKELIFVFCLWMLFTNVNVCFAMLLNGTGHFKNQALLSIVFVSIGLILSYYTAFQYNILGVAVIMMFVTEFLRAPFFYIESKKVIAKL